MCAAVARAEPLDSLLQLLPSARGDTAAVLLYMEIGEIYRKSGNLPLASDYHDRALKLSRRLNYLHGLYYASDYSSFILKRQGKYDEAMALNREMMALALKHSDEYQAAIEKWNIGACYADRGLNETGMAYYLEALEYLEQNNYHEDAGGVYNRIMRVYTMMERYGEAIRYGEKSLAGRSDTLSVAYGYALQSLATSYYSISPPEYGRASDYLYRAMGIARRQGNTVLEANVNNALGNVLFQQGRTAESEAFYLRALAVFAEDRYPREFCVANIGAGKVAMFRHDFLRAEAAALKNLDVSRRHGIRSEERNAVFFLWELAAARGDFGSRNRWKQALDSIQAVLVNESMLRAVEELNMQYETERRELQIASLRGERKLLLGLSLSVGAGLVTAIAAALLLWRWGVQKKRLLAQEIERLEQEKLLIATQALLDGEVKERIRIARDLHDGLGGMLTGLKLNLESVRQGMELDRAGAVRFNNALTILEDSMLELRRVSNHLMPEALSRFGLRTAIGDFCRLLSGKIEFDWYGEDERLKPQLEEVIYRIAYELVNNALKHSGASRIVVQLVLEPGRISLTVQDDGKGFDYDASVGRGMGLTNIRTRAASFGGSFSIYSKPGEGTEASAEFGLG